METVNLEVLPKLLKTEKVKDYKGLLEELIVVELYREGKITLREAAEVLKLNLRRMLALLSKRKCYLNYGEKEFLEDVKYAFSGE